MHSGSEPASRRAAHRAELPTYRIGRGPDTVFLPGLSFDHGVPHGLVRAFETAQMLPLARHRRMHWVGRRLEVPAGYDIADFAADAADHLRAHFPAPVAVVGFSTGGFVGLRLALDHPELVDRLVVVGAGARLGERSRSSETRWLAALEQGRTVEAWRELGADPGLGRGVTASLGWVLGRLGPLLTAGDGRDGAATARADLRFDLTEELGSLRVPTLLVCGAHDPAAPPGLVLGTARSIPGARSLVLPRVGHLASLVHPRTTRTIRAFLSGAAGERPGRAGVSRR